MAQRHRLWLGWWTYWREGNNTGGASIAWTRRRHRTDQTCCENRGTLSGASRYLVTNPHMHTTTHAASDQRTSTWVRPLTSNITPRSPCRQHAVEKASKCQELLIHMTACCLRPALHVQARCHNSHCDIRTSIANASPHMRINRQMHNERFATRVFEIAETWAGRAARDAYFCTTASSTVCETLGSQKIHSPASDRYPTTRRTDMPDPTWRITSVLRDFRGHTSSMPRRCERKPPAARTVWHEHAMV